MNALMLVYVTFPSIESARQIGTVLVEKQLAACVNFIPGVESLYLWQGKLESSNEVLAMFKTSKAHYPRFTEELKTAHPYQVPEIIAVTPESVDPDYLNWALANLQPSP